MNPSWICQSWWRGSCHALLMMTWVPHPIVCQQDSLLALFLRLAPVLGRPFHIEYKTISPDSKSVTILSSILHVEHTIKFFILNLINYRNTPRYDLKFNIFLIGFHRYLNQLLGEFRNRIALGVNEVNKFFAHPIYIRQQSISWLLFLVSINFHIVFPIITYVEHNTGSFDLDLFGSCD